ncbi:hypothetical protein [Bailinhaonella thermotolerans]|uniref:Uncharacterized protein n=1 Tax=Bailinhaonella thermotolerans TaxID=1070861 RepID=A0A3A4A529_9ACTN|nr:hypothetical protein [Bailinhaonella thermotolerans]RJL23926.1 hypothetical protein D5H75_31300 [Bailinhaonella thermotolerans]
MFYWTDDDVEYEVNGPAGQVPPAAEQFVLGDLTAIIGRLLPEYPFPVPVIKDEVPWPELRLDKQGQPMLAVDLTMPIDTAELEWALLPLQGRAAKIARRDTPLTPGPCQ